MTDTSPLAAALPPEVRELAAHGLRQHFGEPTDSKSLAEMAAEVREVNISKGWRRADGSSDRTVGDDTALLASEVFEAFEQWREIGFAERTRENGKPDDFGSEMADVLIRLLDTCDRRGVDLAAEYERKLAFNRTRPYLHGGKAM